MKQLEIEFFFPLTEQINLDLDYSKCNPHEYYLRAEVIGLNGPYPTGMQFVTTATSAGELSAVTINTSKLTITGQPMPWYRKAIFKLLGFNY